jgi:transcriptional regulator with XRE-family HTH domain
VHNEEEIDRTAQHPVTAKVAASVRHLRMEQGISAQKLADRTAELGMPVPRNTIANLENGRRDHVAVDELVALADALGVPPADLLSGDAVRAGLRRRAEELRAEAARLEREAGA